MKKEIEYEIKTITKTKFDKMSKAKQRMTVAQDVIDRIKLEQIIPFSGDTFSTIWNSNKNAKEELQDPKFTCHACALGGMLTSYVGINNEYSIRKLKNSNTCSIASNNTNPICVLFGREQLGLIEMSFEGQQFYWYDDHVSNEDWDKCYRFYKKHDSPSNRLIAICKNIIKNKGTFKP